MALQRNRGKLQTGNPALSTGFQGGDVGGGEGEAYRLIQKCSGFGGGKTQVGGAQLRQVASGT